MKTDVDEMTKSNGMAKHLNVSDVKVTFNIGGASVKLDNLFNGDLELGELMNKFLNGSFVFIFNQLLLLLLLYERANFCLSLFQKIGEKLRPK